jgi:hypothetical protein
MQNTAKMRKKYNHYARVIRNRIHYLFNNFIKNTTDEMLHEPEGLGTSQSYGE